MQRTLLLVIPARIILALLPLGAGGYVLGLLTLGCMRTAKATRRRVSFISNHQRERMSQCIYRRIRGKHFSETCTEAHVM